MFFKLSLLCAVCILPMISANFLDTFSSLPEFSRIITEEYRLSGLVNAKICVHTEPGRFDCDGVQANIHGSSRNLGHYNPLIDGESLKLTFGSKKITLEQNVLGDDDPKSIVTIRETLSN